MFGTKISTIFNQCRFDGKFTDYLTGNKVTLNQCTCNEQLYLVPAKLRNITLRNCDNISIWDTTTGLNAKDVTEEIYYKQFITINNDKITYGTIDGGYKREYADNDLIPKYLLDSIVPTIESIDDETINTILDSAYNSVISRTTRSPQKTR